MALAICSMTWTVSTEATIDEGTAGSVRLWWQRAPLLEVWHVVMFVSHASFPFRFHPGLSLARPQPHLQPARFRNLESPRRALKFHFSTALKVMKV